MGKRGPRRTPTALRILRGNPSGRRLPEDEPTPAPLPENVEAALRPGARHRGPHERRSSREVSPVRANASRLGRLDRTESATIMTAGSRLPERP